jgi:hypothetical protein
MTTFEWISLILVLLGGFGTLYRQLTKIEVSIAGKVGYRECHEKRDSCPCWGKVEKMEEMINELHPHEK